jgi:dephospho-CoA kinase
MIILGLTGSIGMGKSTAAAMFRDSGVPVFDADRCVHHIYAGQPPEALASRFPTAIIDGRIDRQRLASLALDDPDAISALEKIIHPAVENERNKFVGDERDKGARVVALDVPLLLETELWRRVDAVVVVSAPEKIQRERVLSREAMDEAKFDNILKRQIPDAKKKLRAHFILETQFGFEHTHRQVNNIISTLSQIDR